MRSIENLISQFAYSGAWLVACALIFGLLARAFPMQAEQSFWRSDMRTDVLYWFFPALIYGVVTQWLIILFGAVAQWGGTESATAGVLFVHTPWEKWPLLGQALLLLLITDLLQYWLHRLFHGRWLWRFHAIHHSARQVDWLTCVRFHPVNFIFYSSLVAALMYLIGFAREVFVLLVPFNILYSALVHANLRWSFGPLRYVLASPVFHRWHHTKSHEGGNKNFAPTFPFLDVLFGTFYMPVGGVPKVYGTDEDDVPDRFIGQMIYPFFRNEGRR